MTVRQKQRRGFYSKLAKELVRQKDKTQSDLVILGTSFAKFISPRKSGAMAASIYPFFGKTRKAINMRHSQSGKTYNIDWQFPDSQLNLLAEERNWKLTGLADSVPQGKRSLGGVIKPNMTMAGTFQYLTNVAPVKASGIVSNAWKTAGGKR